MINFFSAPPTPPFENMLPENKTFGRGAFITQRTLLLLILLLLFAHLLLCSHHHLARSEHNFSGRRPPPLQHQSSHRLQLHHLQHPLWMLSSVCFLVSSAYFHLINFFPPPSSLSSLLSLSLFQTSSWISDRLRARIGRHFNQLENFKRIQNKQLRTPLSGTPPLPLPFPPSPSLLPSSSLSLSHVLLCRCQDTTQTKQFLMQTVDSL